MSTSLPFHLKYRPPNLDKIIGHEKIVTRLKGIIESKRIPNAILLTGPSSAGKTTLARAFVASLFGVESIEKGHRDFHEMNAADTRGIEDIRDLIKVSKLSPSVAPRRVFLIDECLDGDTEVEVLPGEFVKIKDLVRNKSATHVLSFNQETNQRELKEIISKMETTKESYYEITLEDGTLFKCSDNHKWWVANKQCWLRTDEIEEGDSVLGEAFDNTAD